MTLTRYSDNPFKISITQKGIYVTDINNSSPTEFIINNTSGAINIKNKIDLNINRNGLARNSSLQKMFLKHSIDLLKKIFQSSEWIKMSNKTKAEMVRYIEFKVINRHSRGYRLNMETILGILEEELYYFIHTKYNSSPTLIKDFLGTNNTFILYDSYDSRNKVSKEIGEICKNSNYKVLNAYSSGDNLVMSIIESKKYGYEVITINGYSYLLVKQGAQNEKFEEISYYKCINYDSNIICDTLNGDKIFFNLKHPIVKYTLKNKKNILENIKLFKLFKNFYDDLERFVSYNPNWDLEKESSLKQLQKILDEINNELATAFTIQENDFAENKNRKKMVAK